MLLCFMIYQNLQGLLARNICFKDISIACGIFNCRISKRYYVLSTIYLTGIMFCLWKCWPQKAKPPTSVQLMWQTKGASLCLGLSTILFNIINCHLYSASFIGHFNLNLHLQTSPPPTPQRNGERKARYIFQCQLTIYIYGRLKQNM